ncbi:MAG: Lrp/AsnC family transcriptional regulator, partial [Clostridiales bacterium]|nr:Lrp/AsnC family transcriptional regulator [Clostridiales bacterium]
MDIIDIRIINILQENARTPVSDISKKVNLSSPAVADRIRKMVDNGVIREFTTILEPNLNGRELEALLFISLRRSETAPKFMKLVEEENDVLSCYYLTGDYDYMMRISTRNTVSLEKLLSKFKNLHEFARTRTIIVLKTIKELHS